MILDEYNKGPHVLLFDPTPTTFHRPATSSGCPTALLMRQTLSPKAGRQSLKRSQSLLRRSTALTIRPTALTRSRTSRSKVTTIDVKYDLDEHTLTFETNGGSAISGHGYPRQCGYKTLTRPRTKYVHWLVCRPQIHRGYDFATVLEANKTIYAKFELTSTPIGDICYDVLHIKRCRLW